MRQILRKPKFRAKYPVIILLLIMMIVGSFGRIIKLLQVTTVKASELSTISTQLKEENTKLTIVAQVATASSKPVRLSDEAFDKVVSLLFPPEAGKRFKEIVTKCENSSRDPKRFNLNKDGTIDLGVSQINQVHTEDIEKLFNEDFHTAMSDSIKNILYAAKLYRDQGNFSAWSCDRKI